MIDYSSYDYTSLASIFDLCCKLMQVYSPKVGLTYKQFNVILFVFVQPFLILLFMFTTWWFRLKSKRPSL